MRKIFIIFIISLIFASCYSYPINTDNLTKNKHVWDESKPKEENVELILETGITVKTYNGISVDWGKSKTAQVILPPGEIVFEMDINSYNFIGTNMVFRWKFEAGERFSLKPWQRDNQYGILLWNLNTKMKTEEMPFYPFPRPERVILQ